MVTGEGDISTVGEMDFVEKILEYYPNPIGDEPLVYMMNSECLAVRTTEKIPDIMFPYMELSSEAIIVGVFGYLLTFKRKIYFNTQSEKLLDP